MTPTPESSESRFEQWWVKKPYGKYDTKFQRLSEEAWNFQDQHYQPIIEKLEKEVEALKLDSQNYRRKWMTAPTDKQLQDKIAALTTENAKLKEELKALQTKAD